MIQFKVVWRKMLVQECTEMQCFLQAPWKQSHQHSLVLNWSDDHWCEWHATNTSFPWERGSSPCRHNGNGQVDESVTAFKVISITQYYICLIHDIKLCNSILVIHRHICPRGFDLFNAYVLPLLAFGWEPISSQPLIASSILNQPQPNKPKFPQHRWTPMYLMWCTAGQ